MIRSRGVVYIIVLGLLLGSVPGASAQKGEITVQDDVNGKCPPGFVVVSDLPKHPKDQNGNGIVCASSPALSTPKPEATKSDKAGVPKPEATKSQSSDQKQGKGETTTKRVEVVDDVKGSCPSKYTPVRDTIPRPEDQNRNGLVCLRLI